jgi:hypothetical protein
MKELPMMLGLSHNALPHPLPSTDGARLALFTIRRLGARGLQDADLAGAYLEIFGAGFRRPLTLARTMMAEIAATATVDIQIAPPCCVRVTGAEHALLAVLAQAERQPERARLLLADLLAQRRADGVLATAIALAGAFADAGMPIG